MSTTSEWQGRSREGRSEARRPSASKPCDFKIGGVPDSCEVVEIFLSINNVLSWITGFVDACEWLFGDNGASQEPK